jgi:hypothetical protein
LYFSENEALLAENAELKEAVAVLSQSKVKSMHVYICTSIKELYLYLGGIGD